MLNNQSGCAPNSYKREIPPTELVKQYAFFPLFLKQFGI